jgi:hypothetical protein
MDGVLHDLHNNPWFAGFHYACMLSMVLLVYDPNMATWASNFASHMVQGYGNVPEVYAGLTGGFNAAAPAVAAKGAVTTAGPVLTPLPIEPATAATHHGMHHGLH